MEIRFMKQSALLDLKNSLPGNFSKYFTESDNSWVSEICQEPFLKFCDVPDFELESPLSGQTGKIEIENCKRVYKNLNFLTPSQAADERLWTGLCHDIFYDYVRQRFGYNAVDKTDFSTTDDEDDDEIKKLSANDKEITRIKNRFFFNGGARERLLKNPISRYWWTGRALCDSTKDNHFEKLDIIGENDFYTKIFSTLSRSFAANPVILNGVVKCFEYFNDKDINLNRDKQNRRRGRVGLLGRR